TELAEQGSDELGQPEIQIRRASQEMEDFRRLAAPTGPGTVGGRDPARVAVLLIAIVILVGAVPYLGPILKPFLVPVFLYFSTRAAVRYLIRLHVPASLAYLVLFVIGSAAAAALTLLAYGEVMAFRAEWPRYQQRILGVIGKAPAEASGPLSEVFTVSSREVF